LPFVVISVSSFLSQFVLRRFPRLDPRKRLPLVLALLAAGCGGGSGDASTQEVRGVGYSFNAPAGWEVTRSGRTVTAANDENAVVSVTRFELDRTYEARLDAQVTAELNRVARTLARKLGGTAGRLSRPRIAQRRAWSYELSGTRDGTTRIAFVLVARREYQLLCRGGSEDVDACRRLFASFRLR
jgi:hypothetical protein